MRNLSKLFFFSVITLNVACANKPWSVRFADSEMNRNPEVYSDWDYVTGTVLKGFEAVWRLTGDKKYFNYIKATIDSIVSQEGVIDDYDVEEYNIDEVATGRVLLMLYNETKEEKYKIAAQTVRSQFNGHPRTSEGGFWHKQIYPWQMWLDGLYMGSPFYAEYGKMFDEPAIFDDVVNQFLLIEKH